MFLLMERFFFTCVFSAKVTCAFLALETIEKLSEFNKKRLYFSDHIEVSLGGGNVMYVCLYQKSVCM